MTKEQIVIGLSDALRVEINENNKPDDRVYALNYRRQMEAELLRRLDEADALRKENEELRKDKERLDWLNNHDETPNWYTAHWTIISTCGNIRAAIDAEKAKESEASHEH
jgi:hypothetical protein